MKQVKHTPETIARAVELAGQGVVVDRIQETLLSETGHKIKIGTINGWTRATRAAMAARSGRVDIIRAWLVTASEIREGAVPESVRPLADLDQYLSKPHLWAVICPKGSNRSVWWVQRFSGTIDGNQVYAVYPEAGLPYTIHTPDEAGFVSEMMVRHVALSRIEPELFGRRAA
jgi:hypothetical protein